MADTTSKLDSLQMLDVRAVARLLGCCPRNVRRLSDAGRMPQPLKIGALVRWRADELQAWIAAGCPEVRTMRRTESGGVTDA